MRLGMRKVTGFSLLELIVVIAVLGLVIGLLVPGLAIVRAKNNRIGCVSHLKNIGLGFRIYAHDHGERFPMTDWTQSGPTPSPGKYFAALSNVLSITEVLICPAERSRPVAPSFVRLQPANLSYFVGLDVPRNSVDGLLAGDRNLMLDGVPVQPGVVRVTTNRVVGWSAEMHRFQGNVAVGDGSVQSLQTVPQSRTRAEPLLVP